MHPCSTIPSRWLCINILMNYSAISQVMFVLVWLLFCLHCVRIKSAVAWVRSVQPECTISKGTWNFPNFKPEIFGEWKAPSSCYPVHSYIQGFSLVDCGPKFPFPFIPWQLLLHVHIQIRISFLFFRSHRSDTLPSRGCLLPLGSLETTASGIRPSRSGAENSFEC